MSDFFLNKSQIKDHSIGGKASNLLKLEQMNIPVPKWVVIPEAKVLQQLPKENNIDTISDNFKSLNVPNDLNDQLEKAFGLDFKTKTFAVRSSSSDEDGSQFSFAGQFETFLHVPYTDIENRIKQVWESVVSDRVLTYRKENNLSLQLGISVIIQEMIAAEVAGVAFGMNPVSGDKNSKIISSVYGLGEGLVSGELDADTYTLSDQKIDEQLASKTHAFVRDANNNGIIKEQVDANKWDLPSLNSNQLKEISDLLDRLNTQLDSPQDIEFAYQNDTLYLLQTRPITSKGDNQQGEYILWDNSNIVESYPGITTPLTYSFIIKMYEMVYRQFVGLLGVNHKEIEHHKNVFENTLGLVRGRVYYNLLSWYKMLAMVPGYSINAEFMENMMGVKERFELKDDYQMSKGLARLRIVTMLFKMISLQRKLPKERQRFYIHLNKTMDYYKSIDFSSLTSKEIVTHYTTFEQSLLLKWNAPLINDFFAMIWFGLLQKQTKKYCLNDPNIHNDLLCGSEDIISVEPVKRSMELSRQITQDEDCYKLFKENDPNSIWDTLNKGRFPKIKALFNDYIDTFGERCIGELKLESISYTQEPTLFVKIIKSYVEQGITKKQSNQNIEEDLRSKAKDKISSILKNKSIKKWWFTYILNKARDLVSNRENLRYERTRGFGMVRTMFTALGNKLAADGLIDHPRDVFHLELDEIKSLETLAFNPEFKTKIQERIEEFKSYKAQTPPQERFYTYGNNFTDEYIYSDEKLEGQEEDLKGIGCCPGRIKAKVRVVLDPNEIESLNGDILVTSSTDPGWITLFPTASAIIVERGSLLSHSAIVSREMGIPCIVSVTGLLRTLKTGDEILMDGSTGEINIIKS